MKVPTSEFLDSIERLYSVKYPREYREFCARFKDTVLQAAEHFSGPADFIADIETFQAVNVRVGEGQWGDWERALVGQERPKDKNILWGGILPFCFAGDTVFGFHTVYGLLSDGSLGEQVHVWAVHTLVHSYPSLAAFAEAYLAPNA